LALDSYTNLKTEIADWMHRSDLTSYLDTFIDLTEQMFKGQPRKPEDAKIGGVRVLVKRATGTLSTGTSTLAKPSDYLAAYSLDLTADSGSLLKYLPADEMPTYFRSGPGQPTYWTASDVIQFDIAPDADYAYELAYWAQPAGLSGSVATNEILTGYPMCYLSGCLHHAAKFIRDEQNAQYWLAQYKAYAWAANEQFKAGTVSQGNLRARVA